MNLTISRRLGLLAGSAVVVVIGLSTLSAWSTTQLADRAEELDTLWARLLALPLAAVALTAFAAHCRSQGVRFGVGLSPYELYRDFGDVAKADLTRKLAWLDAIGVDDLGILFDDMRGDLPDLAKTQVEILHWIAARTFSVEVVASATAVRAMTWRSTCGAGPAAAIISAATNSIIDLEYTDTIMVIGANPTDAHPVTGAKIKQQIMSVNDLS